MKFYISTCILKHVYNTGDCVVLHLLGLEAWTLSRLGAADVGCPLFRLRQRLEDSTVLGGPEREGHELNVTPELGLPVWALPPLAPSGLM